MLKLRNVRLGAIAIAASLTMYACGGSSSSSRSIGIQSTPPTTVNFEVVHASQDAPAVNVTAGATTVAEALDFGEAAFFTTGAGEVTIAVEGIIPGGNATVISATDTFVDGQRVTIFAADEVANIGPILLLDDQPTVADTDVRVRVVHAASNVTPIAAMVDIYITAPADPITSTTPITAMFGDATDALVVPAGDYRIRVTPAASSTVVYDSGTVALAGGSDLVVAAIPNVGPGAAPIELIATTGSGALRLIDSATPADLRVAHISADAGIVDVAANDNFTPPAVEDLTYQTVTGYLTLPAGPINFKVTAANDATAVAIDTLDTVALEAGETYTVFATGLVADGTLAPEVVVDNPRRVSTESRVRVFHGSPSAGVVDLYVVGPGADITDVEPNFAGVTFFSETGYVSLAPGSYDVIVTEAGEKMPAIPRAAITVEAGGIYTAIATDASGGGEPIGLTLADDFL